MKFEKYYIEDKNGKSNCVIRTFCKLFNVEYENVYDELCLLANELNCSSFNDVIVFETYMDRNNITCFDDSEYIVKELELDNGSYVVFCYDKDNFYHMIPIINNTIYDKNDKCLDLYTIKAYKKN